MNRHRLYWSAMGYEAKTEPSAKQKRLESNKQVLKDMVAIDGFDAIASLMREIWEEMDESRLSNR